jgi:PAT family beta-lactamase induction signal transducer AmpG
MPADTTAAPAESPASPTAATPADKWLDALRFYLKPKSAAMLLLGFVAGLPFLLVYGVLSARLAQSGVSRTAIGFFVWLGLFYTLKFLWAPMVDRVRLPGLHEIFGQRRSWILLAQAGMIVGMIGVGLSDPQSSLLPLVMFALLIAFSSATQDVGIDAWRIEASPGADAQASMAAVYQFGYRLGLMTAQTGALLVAGLLSPNDAQGSDIYTPHAWTAAYWVMAALVLIGSSTVIWAGEPSREKAGEGPWPRMEGLRRNLVRGGVAVAAIVAAVVVAFFIAPYILSPIGKLLAPIGNYFYAVPVIVAALPFALAVACVPYVRRLPADSPLFVHPASGPFLEFFKRLGWMAVLVFGMIALYRISDFTMGVMAKPMYVEVGYSLETIGWVTGLFGIFVGIAGALAAGAFAIRYGLLNCLVAGAIITIVTNASFAWLASGEAETWRLVVAISLDNTAGGFAGGILIAYMSSLTNTAFTATQYALFSSLYAIYSKVLAGFSGVLADAVGYVWFFLITAGFGVPALVLTLLLLSYRERLAGMGPPAAAPTPG